MKKAFVTGAAGFVGSNLCRELLESGWEVTAFIRRGSKAPALEGLVLQIAEGDITDLATLNAAVPGHDAVFHIAALYRQAKFPDAEYFRVNEFGTEQVFRAAISAGVPTVLHCSTIGVHSHIPNPPANESEPYAPTDVYQESKMKGEQHALRQYREGKVRGAVIRPAMIWGPGDTRFLKMFRGIARQRMPVIGSGKLLTHWILVTDLARAFRLAAETPESTGQIYIIAGARPVPLNQVFQAIATELGVPKPWLHLPAWPIQVIGSIVESLCRPFGWEPPLHRRRADFFIKQRAFDTSKAQRELRFVPAGTFEDEVRTICSWYRQQGWL
jgi:nucleoside-diphosphate-sugar epimerase